MDSKITYIATKIDKMDEKLDTVLEHNKNTDITLARQNLTLEHHVERSNAIQKHVQTLEDEIKPIKRNIAMVEGGFKVVGATATFFGFIAGLYKLITMLKG